jgi:hypothetical protein
MTPLVGAALSIAASEEVLDAVEALGERLSRIEATLAAIEARLAPTREDEDVHASGD